jgi:hypothetical protein
MRSLYAFFILSLLVSNATLAQTETDARKVPILNDHFFPSSTQVRSSFINTHLQTDIGFGKTSALKIPGIVVGDNELFAFEGSILFVDLNIQYQQRFTDWLALYTNIKLAGRLGSDMSTILADGVNTISGGEIGWLIRIKETQKLNLAATVSVTNLTGNFINVVDYFEEIVNNNPNPSVIKKVPTMNVGIGLRGAYAFNATYGFQFQGDFAYGESLQRLASQGFFSAGFLADMDFMPKQNVPLGLAVGYTLSTAPEIVMNDGDFASIFATRLYFTGSEDFELGAQFNYYNVRLNSIDSKPFVSKILLTLKFYF